MMQGVKIVGNNYTVLVYRMDTAWLVREGLHIPQGFDPGQVTYQEPPEDGSQCNLEVDPKRWVWLNQGATFVVCGDVGGVQWM